MMRYKPNKAVRFSHLNFLPRYSNLEASGYVYFIFDSHRNIYKIGIASELPSRLRAIERELGYKIELIHFIHSSRRTKLEKTLHAKFADKHLGHEWFELSEADVKYVKGLGL